MRIFIFGNLNAGKSHLCQQLLPYLPDYQHLELDHFRKEYGDGTLNGEEIAVTHFIQNVLNQSNCLVDYSGYGEVAKLLQQNLPTCTGILLICSRSAVDCISTIDPNKYASVPYPQVYKQHQDLQQTINYLVPNVSETALTEQWKNFIWQTYNIPYGLNITSLLKLLNLEHHKVVEQIKIIALENHKIRSTVIYGSMGANKFNKHSDIDIFIESDCQAKDLKKYFENKFTTNVVHCDLLNNKITFRMASGLLVELVCGSALNDTALYFRESQIKHVCSCVLKGDSTTIKQLQLFVENKKSLSVRAKNTAADLYFLFCSLPNLIEKQDTYKYHFHVSIMQHYAIQLEHLFLGNDQHNYLPKYASQSLPEFPWLAFASNALTFCPNQYKQLHCYLLGLFNKLVEQKLITKGQYFTSQNAHLHQIEQCV